MTTEVKKLARKGQTWNITEFHKWKDRHTPKIPVRSLIQRDSKIFTMGSCFAANVVAFLTNTKNLNAHFFPETRHYDPASIAQELQHLLVKKNYHEEDMWTTSEGQHANPFRKPTHREDSIEALLAWNENVDNEAMMRLQNADLLVITLGGTETWRHPQTKKTYLTLPFPDVFNHQPEIAEFHQLSYQECYDALENIYLLIRKHFPKMKMIVTVSPNRMSFTTTPHDVVQATCQGKSTLRTAVAELLRKYEENIYYFHSYELVEYAEYPHLFLDAQQRHVKDFAVEYVMNHFTKYFAPEIHDNAAYELTLKLVRDQASEYQVTPSDIWSPELVRRAVVKGFKTLNMNRMAQLAYNIGRQKK